jgi:hypothetical protein
MSRILALVGVFWFFAPLATASAQPRAIRPAPSAPAAAEATIGYTGFGDDGLIHHTGIGATLRVHLTPRLSVGPEISYHIGPSRDRDLLLQGVAYFDLRRPSPGAPGRIEPYVLAGGGARVWVTRRAYVVADARLGWPPNVRVVTGLGLLLR